MKAEITDLGNYAKGQLRRHRLPRMIVIDDRGYRAEEGLTLLWVGDAVISTHRAAPAPM